MTTQLIRSLLIAIFAILIHSVFNISKNVSLSAQIQYPLIVAITPFVISKIPLLGTRDLMAAGGQPFMSLLFMVCSTVLMQYLIEEIKKNNQNDFLSTYLKNDTPLQFGQLEIQRDFVILIAFVLFLDFFYQLYNKNQKYKTMEKVVLRALAKFHGKKSKV